MPGKNKKSNFIQWSATVFTKHTVEQGSYSNLVGQHKTHKLRVLFFVCGFFVHLFGLGIFCPFLVVLYLFFFREIERERASMHDVGCLGKRGGFMRNCGREEQPNYAIQKKSLKVGAENLIRILSLLGKYVTTLL